MHSQTLDLSKKKNRKRAAHAMLKGHKGQRSDWCILSPATSQSSSADKIVKELALDRKMGARHHSMVEYVGMGRYDGLHTWIRSLEGDVTVIAPWTTHMGALTDSWANGGESSAAETGWIPGFAGVAQLPPVIQRFDASGEPLYSMAITELPERIVCRAFAVPSQCRINTITVVLVAWPNCPKAGLNDYGPQARKVHHMWAHVSEVIPEHSHVCVIPPLDKGHPADAFLRTGSRVLGPGRTLHVRVPPHIQQSLAVCLPTASSATQPPPSSLLPGGIRAAPSSFQPPHRAPGEVQDVTVAAVPAKVGANVAQEEKGDGSGPSPGPELRIQEDMAAVEPEAAAAQSEAAAVEPEAEVAAQSGPDLGENEDDTELDLDLEHELVKPPVREVITCVYYPGAELPTVEGDGDMKPHWDLNTPDFQLHLVTQFVADMETIAPRSRNLELQTSDPDVVLSSLLRCYPMSSEFREKWRASFLRGVQTWFEQHVEYPGSEFRPVQYQFLPSWLDIFSDVVSAEELNGCVRD